MSDKSTMMPTLKVSREWASDWADKYEQSWTPARLSEFVGKNVSGITPQVDGEEQRGFKSAFIVGYSVDTVVFQVDDESDETAEAYRFSLLTSDGKQVALLASMEVSEDEE